jgi:hypothetical protein
MTRCASNGRLGSASPLIANNLHAPGFFISKLAMSCKCRNAAPSATSGLSLKPAQEGTRYKEQKEADKYEPALPSDWKSPSPAVTLRRKPVFRLGQASTPALMRRGDNNYVKRVVCAIPRMLTTVALGVCGVVGRSLRSWRAATL